MQTRTWHIDEDPLIASDDHVIEALAEAAAILRRIGGALMMVPIREEIAPGIFETTHYALKWESYSHAKRFEPEVESPEPEPEPEPEAEVESEPEAVPVAVEA